MDMAMLQAAQGAQAVAQASAEVTDLGAQPVIRDAEEECSGSEIQGFPHQ